jgi:hypothetical protein
MYLAYALHQTARLTFGRETAQFKQLIAFMAILSVTLWTLVALTLLARMLFCHVWYRRRYVNRDNKLPPG